MMPRRDLWSCIDKRPMAIVQARRAAQIQDFHVGLGLKISIITDNVLSGFSEQKLKSNKIILAVIVHTHKILNMCTFENQAIKTLKTITQSHINRIPKAKNPLLKASFIQILYSREAFGPFYKVKKTSMKQISDI